MPISKGGNKFKALRQIAVFPLFSKVYDALNWVQGLKAVLRQVLRRMAVFPFVFKGLRRLKLSEWLKFNSRQILRQRNCLFYSELSCVGLKSQII